MSCRACCHLDALIFTALVSSSTAMPQEFHRLVLIFVSTCVVRQLRMLLYMSRSQCCLAIAKETRKGISSGGVAVDLAASRSLIYPAAEVQGCKQYPLLSISTTTDEHEFGEDATRLRIKCFIVLMGSLLSFPLYYFHFLRLFQSIQLQSSLKHTDTQTAPS